jgi:predicted nucleic acid-binding protein
MQPVLFDSSIYITALRTGDEAALSMRRLAVDSPVWLSAVVLEELYAGIAPRSRHVLERFERDFEKARRILAQLDHLRAFFGFLQYFSLLSCAFPSRRSEKMVEWRPSVFP